MVRGLYREANPNDESGRSDWAWIEPRGSVPIEECKTRGVYDALGGQPPFDELPTKAQYDAANA